MFIVKTKRIKIYRVKYVGAVLSACWLFKKSCCFSFYFMCSGCQSACRNRAAPTYSSLCSIRVGWWISEHNAFLVIWNLFGIETAVQKDFSQKSVFWKVNFDPKKPYLRNEQELEKVEEVWPPLKLKNNGGLNSITFSDSSSLMRKMNFLIFWAFFPRQILSIIMIFEKNPFAQCFLYLKAFIWPWRHYVLRFINQP